MVSQVILNNAPHNKLEIKSLMTMSSVESVLPQVTLNGVPYMHQWLQLTLRFHF